MATNGHTFLDKVLEIVKEGRQEDVPLIEFRHPKELEKLLDLEIKDGVTDGQLEQSVRQILRYSVKTDKPTFRNQLYGGTDPYGLAGAWIAEAFNTSQYTFEVAPVFTLIEQKILSHVLNIFGIPQGDGIFSPGGSCSMLYAIVAARFQAFPEVKTKGLWGLPQLVLFTSEDSHYSIKKAAHWLGFGTENVYIIPTNTHGQIIVSELSRAIKEVKNAKKYPLMVNATAGTTVLGAFDNLEAVADVCEEFGIWMHVDACWGGSLMLSTIHRSKLSGIYRSNSIAWNPHKMLGAPLQCSMFLVRHRGLLHEANSAAAQYLFQQDKFYDVSYDTGDKSVQCGRKIDAFKLWVMWKARGDQNLSSYVDHTMDIALFCHISIQQRPGFQLVVEPLQGPNVCFWYIPKFMRERKENEEWWEQMHKITPKIKELLTLSSKLMVAYSPLRGFKNFFRLAFTLHPQLEKHQVLKMLDSIEECGEQVTKDMLSATGCSNILWSGNMINYDKK